jgi:DNA processing protein
MGTDALTRLQHAVAATRFGGGQRTFGSKVRATGMLAFEDIVESLGREQRQGVEDQAAELLDSGIDAVLLPEDAYPPRLGSSRHAPAALFVKGPVELLDQRAIGMCGSRQASSEGLRAAFACADAAARRRYCVVSGYARGVDLAAHTAALAGGGTTVIVLAEGISRFRIRQGEFTELWDPQRALVVSQFAPDQKWFASGAMARNTVISGLSQALVVVEAGETGGTLAAGEYALQRGQTVLALQLFDAPPGNAQLIANGAKVIHSRQHLETALDDLDEDGSRQLMLI